MNFTDEALITEETDQENDAVFKDAWPIPEEDLIREFEEYLLDIGVRI